MNTIHCFAVLLHNQQRYDEAFGYYLRACEGSLKTLGLVYDVIQKYTGDYASILGKIEREGVISREEHVDRLGALQFIGYGIILTILLAYNQGG